MIGFLNIYKPQGITSFDVIRRLRGLVPRLKAGHLGTLDPMAQGVLPIAVGKATRLINFIENRSKSYLATMVLGGYSDTQDSTGNIVWQGYEPIELDQLEAVIRDFVGEIQQVPANFSAVHYQGRRAYELARRGVTPQLKPRTVEIKKLTLKQLINEPDRGIAELEIDCSSGTYIRTLCHDIGRRLGCGGYMQGLIRTRSGPFTVENSFPLDYITTVAELESKLLPPQYPLSLPQVNISGDQTSALLHGMPIDSDTGLGDKNLCLLMVAGNKLLGIGRIEKNDHREKINPIRIIG